MMRRRRRFFWTLESALLIAGLVCTGWYGYNWLASGADQLWATYQLNASLRGEQPTLRGFVGDLLQGRRPEMPSVTVAKPPVPGPRRYQKGETIGRIEVPRLKIASVVRQGVDDSTLSRAVGHVPSTALPGQRGNVALAAHRDTYFRNLRDVREGDIIRVITQEGTWEYQVESTKIVTPRNVEVLDPTPHPTLTLVTCYPFNFIGHAPKRFIVQARLLAPEEPAPAQRARRG